MIDAVSAARETSINALDGAPVNLEAANIESANSEAAYDYANILFSGRRCNLGCHGCIGENAQLQGLPGNLGEYPIKNIDGMIEVVNRYNIKDLAFTGTNVDPQMYLHEQELICYVREKLNGSTRLSLHTNGLLAFKKIEEFNSYDKAAISYHSFNPETYVKMTRAGKRPDLKAIIGVSRIPVKLSMFVSRYNISEIDNYIKRSADLGINRIVVRKPKGLERYYPLETMEPFASRQPIKQVFGWNVYEIYGVETTICGFDTSTAKGIFLFSDGRLEERLVE